MDKQPLGDRDRFGPFAGSLGDLVTEFGEPSPCGIRPDRDPEPVCIEPAQQQVEVGQAQRSAGRS